METFYNLLFKFSEVVLNPIIYFIFIYSFIYFFYNAFRLFVAYGNGNADGITALKSHMFWGIIGMFIMVSVFGFIKLAENTLNDAGLIDSNVRKSIQKVVPDNLRN